MKELFHYLFQSSAVLVVLYGVYWLFLRGETFFSVNRFYLLFSGVVSILIPFFRFDFGHFETIRSAVIYLDPILITPDKVEYVAANHFKLVELAGIIYLAGVLFFSARLILQLIQLYIIVSRDGIIRESFGVNCVFIDKRFSSFSFFNLIIISVPDKNNKELAAILDHEVVHVRQYHSLDLLMMETLKIILWFNPFAWFIGKSIKVLHEFLADEGVLQGGYNKQDYQYLLLHRASGIQVSGLSNNFNYSLIKKRIIMMTKSRSTTMAKGKILFALPALMAVVFFFSLGTISNLLAQDTKAKESAKPVTKTTSATPSTTTSTTSQKQDIKNTDQVFTVVEKQPVWSGGDEARIKFMMENLKYPESAKKKGIQGKVFVTFVIKSDGSVSDVKVLRGVGGGCDEEAVRVVKLMPKWIPGENQGKPVNVQYVLPIKFTLDNHDKKKEEPKK
jgi:TonB family protein